MQSRQALIIFGLINGGIFLLGMTAAYSYDDPAMSFFAWLFWPVLIGTSIWLGIQLNRNRTKKQKQTAV